MKEIKSNTIEYAMSVLQQQRNFIHFDSNGCMIETKKNMMQNAFYAGCKMMLEIILTNAYEESGNIIWNESNEHHFE